MRWRCFATGVATMSLTFVGTASVANAAPAPEIRVATVHFQSYDTPSGTVFSFGHTLVGVPFLVDYTITNIGEEGSQLDLANVTVPAGFSLVQTPAAALAAGQSTTLRLRCDAVAVGYYPGTVSIDTNDLDENPFTFGVSCSVNASGPQGLMALWSSAAGGELVPSATLTLASGATARIWARDILGAPAALQFDPVVVAPSGPAVSGWSPGNVSAAVPVSFTLSCTDDAGAPLIGNYSVTVSEALPQSITFQLDCVDADLPIGGSDFTSIGLRAAAVLLALGGLLRVAGRRRAATSA